MRRAAPVKRLFPAFSLVRAMRCHCFHGGRGAPGTSERVKAARSAPRSGLRALTRSRRVRELPDRKECSYEEGRSDLRQVDIIYRFFSSAIRLV
jgi:hypothetical protein